MEAFFVWCWGRGVMGWKGLILFYFGMVLVACLQGRSKKLVYEGAKSGINKNIITE